MTATVSKRLLITAVAATLAALLLYIMSLHAGSRISPPSTIWQEPISSPENQACGDNCESYNEKEPAANVKEELLMTFTGRECDSLVSDIEEFYACRRKHLLQGCGEVCDTNITGKPSLFFDFMEKKFSCRNLWANKFIDSALLPEERPPPKNIPEFWQNDFSHGGKVNLIQDAGYAPAMYLGEPRDTEWSKEMVDEQVALVLAGTLNGNYGVHATIGLYNTLKNTVQVEGKSVIVIGSEIPWVEACLLAAGAAHVTTLEYGTIISRHPQISTLTPNEARKLAVEGKLEFDGVVTYSSIEHSGLGRYGDALNPWGDLQTIARAWCITKPGGFLTIGIPNCLVTGDEIEGHLHRCYGHHMWSHLTANWNQIWQELPYGDQSLFVFRK